MNLNSFSMNTIECRFVEFLGVSDGEITVGIKFYLKCHFLFVCVETKWVFSYFFKETFDFFSERFSKDFLLCYFNIIFLKLTFFMLIEPIYCY